LPNPVPIIYLSSGMLSGYDSQCADENVSIKKPFQNERAGIAF
jgi:hypothetical protein